MAPGPDILVTADAVREWMIANGAGGSAHGTAAGPATRRSHAWLHAADGGRVTTILLGFDEQLRIGGETYALQHLPGEPASELPVAALESFGSDPWPVWRLRCGEVAIERSLFLVHGHQAVVVAWTLREGADARLRLGPLVVARDVDQLQRETPAMQGVARGIPGRVRIETVPGRPTLTTWHNGSFLPARMWRRGIAYPGEGARAAEHEDAFVPGFVESPLAAGGTVHLVASTDESLFRSLAMEGRLGTPPPSTLADCVAALGRFERARDREFRHGAARGLVATARMAAAAHDEAAGGSAPEPALAEDDPWIERLLRGLQTSLVHRGGRLTAVRDVAGLERGSDALRVVPGLVAAQGYELVRALLSGFLGYVDDGAVPSGFEPDGTPRYEDPDAALWLLLDTELLTRRSEDPAWARVALANLESVAQHYRAGNRYGVRVDHDGLLATGEDGAKHAATNALWYYALVAMSQLSRLSGRKEASAFYLAWARQHGQSFNDLFWNDAAGCLHVALGAGAPAEGPTPGQLHAICFSPALLPPERAQALLDRIESDLFTPYGLRPAPGAPRVETEWLGAFHTACLRVRGRGPEVQDQVRERLDRLRERIDETTVDYVPACFVPPAPRKGSRGGTAAPVERWIPEGASGTAAAELLRAWVEEVAHPASAVARP